jgi:enoyl-CoA hydratase/carnithine racemase
MSGALGERYERLKVTRDGTTLTITLAYPERRNAIGPLMTNELLYALESGSRDASVRVIVLTGEGKAFCAGGDFAEMSGGHARPPKGDYADLLLALCKTDKPVIARVNGHAMGGGLGLVAASTFAVASTEAKLGTPEIDVGLFPMMIMAVLSRLMPRRRLAEMMLTGQKLTAEEAKSAGIVGRVVPPGELDAAVADLAATLAGKSPMTVRLGLRAMADAEDRDLEEALPLLRERLGQCLATDDAREGLTAFLEKRAPVWSGR